MRQRAGRLRRQLSGDAAYEAFAPTPLPPDPPVAVDAETTALLVDAHRRLALLEGAARQIPNVDLVLALYARKEALMSAQIEGTQATLEDVFDPTVEETANRDVADVVNYVRAIDHAVARLREPPPAGLPLCGRLLLETHAILLAGARGEERTPGEFRRSQNWIGGVGSTIRTARYIPPAVEDMRESMNDLEVYLNAHDETDVLIKAALIHYQFETIHPFLDGNGRLGRLLITLYLIDQGILSRPVLYPSYYLKLNRVEYFDRLSQVRRNGDFEQWVRFFLRALAAAADDCLVTINRLAQLRARDSARLQAVGGRRLLAVWALLERTPIITVSGAAQSLAVSFNTAAKAVEALVSLGLIHPTSLARRNRTFAYTEYLEILRPGT